MIETEHEYKPNRMADRRNKWKDKVLHGQFLRQTEEENGKDEKWQRLKNAGIKRKTKSLIVIAQEQAIRSNACDKSEDCQEPGIVE